MTSGKKKLLAGYGTFTVPWIPTNCSLPSVVWGCNASIFPVKNNDNLN
jgi:hypothetical protein